jgi:hypothetical protein
MSRPMASRPGGTSSTWAGSWCPCRKSWAALDKVSAGACALYQELGGSLAAAPFLPAMLAIDALCHGGAAAGSSASPRATMSARRSPRRRCPLTPYAADGARLGGARRGQGEPCRALRVGRRLRGAGAARRSGSHDPATADLGHDAAAIRSSPPFSCTAGEGGERSEPDEGEARKRHWGLASGTPLTLPLRGSLPLPRCRRGDFGAALRFGLGRAHGALFSQGERQPVLARRRRLWRRLVGLSGPGRVIARTMRWALALAGAAGEACDKSETNQL